MPGTTPPPEWSTWPRSALVVATSAYADKQFAQLRAPAQDADDLVAVLSDPRIGGFEVTVLLDQPVDRLRREIERFLADRIREELLVVYLSCHGILDKRNALHFAATDTSKNLLASTGIESHWLLGRLDDCGARQQVLILDCCFSGAFAKGTKGEGDLDLKQHVVGSGRGRMVLTASRAREYSFEGHALSGVDSPGSVFTSGLVKGLRTGDADVDRDGFVSVEDAYDYAYTYVQTHHTAQTPQRWAFGAEGRIWLARNPFIGGWSERPATAVHGPAASEPREATEGPTASGPTSGSTATWTSTRASDDADTTAHSGTGTAGHPAAAFAAEAGSADSAQGVRGRRRRYHVIALGCVATAGAVTVGLVLTAPSRTTAGAATVGLVPTVASHTAFANAKIITTLTDPNASKPNVDAVAFVPDGRTLAAGNDVGDTYLWDTTTGKITATFTDPTNTGSPVDAVTFAPDGKTLAISEDNGDTYLWNTTTRKLTATFTDPTNTGSPVDAVTFAPDFKTLALGDNNGNTYLWNTTTGKLTATLTIPGLASASVVAIAFAPDGTTLAMAENDGNTYLWNTTTGKLAATLSDPTNNPTSMAPVGAEADAVTFAPDGTTLAIADDYGYTYLWNTATRKPTTTLMNPNDASKVDAVAFAPNGNTVATSDAEGNTYLWDTTTGKITATLINPVPPQHAGKVLQRAGGVRVGRHHTGHRRQRQHVVVAR